MTSYEITLYTYDVYMALHVRILKRLHQNCIWTSLGVPLWQPRWRFCLLDCNDEGSLPHLQQIRCCTLCICYLIGHITDQPILNALRAFAKATNSWLPISLPKHPFLLAAYCRMLQIRKTVSSSVRHVRRALLVLTVVLLYAIYWSGGTAFASDFHPRTSKKHH